MNVLPEVAAARRALARGRSRWLEGRDAAGRDARRLWPGLLVAAGLLLHGCGPDVTPPGPGLRDQATLRVVTSALPAMVNTLVVEVAAPDISPSLIFNIPASGGIASGTISMPAGSARTVTIRAFDAGAIETHRGSKTIDVHPGANPSISISLIPIAGNQPIDVRLESLIIAVTPQNASLRVEQTVTRMLQATVTRADGTPLEVDPKEIRWATLHPSIATVDVDGSVTALAPGTATVVAVYRGFGAAATVTVEPGLLLLAAGDVADCVATSPLPDGNTGEQTVRLLEAYPTATVAMLGDGAYDDGTAAEYADCYHRSWGRVKARTMPTPGNHEYRDPGPPRAAGYFGYFGTVAPLPTQGFYGDPARGYYSFNLGAWHIVSLNSEIGVKADTPQTVWLRNDLAANAAKCTLLFWHRPRFSSGSSHGNDLDYKPFWDVAYEANVDVILGAHDHNYEVFAPQDPNGVADPVRGIRTFVVGSGGHGLIRRMGTIQPNSEFTYPAAGVTTGVSTQSGVLKLELRERSYKWEFIATGKGVINSGSGVCH